MRRTICLLLLLVVAAPAIVAADFYKGRAAYKRGEFEAAFPYELTIDQQSEEVWHIGLGGFPKRLVSLLRRDQAMLDEEISQPSVIHLGHRASQRSVTTLVS